MDKKPKILLLSDDLRMGSGVATISRQLVTGLVNDYDWVQIGGAVKHPDEGKVLDLSESISKEFNVENISVKIYPTSGYGDADMLRRIIMMEQPNAIVHFTDPRYWIWLYEIAHEIREILPIGFYHIWDDLPDPMYNRDYFESCDWIGCISRQTYGIVKRVWGSKTKESWATPEDWQVTYVPHGINEEDFYPVESEDDIAAVKKIRNDLISECGNDVDFIVFWSNRNIRRKQPGDVILSFKMFNDMLTPEQQKRTLLFMHTAPVDDNGTDLIAVKDAICPDLNVIFSSTPVATPILNTFYNLADVTLNIANNEGFGLTTCEGVMAGTPTIVNVTGGLQDQCGFTLDGKEFTADDYIEIGSLHDWREWEGKLEHGEWVVPIWPKVRSLNGSPPTPYIYDDRVDNIDVANALHYWYTKTPEERKAAGLAGRNWLMNGKLNNAYMCEMMKSGIDTMLEKFTPYRRFELYKI